MQRARNFLHKQDNYSQVVSLTYNKSGKFATSIGGCCSIIVSLALLYWIAINFTYVIIDNGIFSTSTKESLTQLATGEYPRYNITG